jgi:hypothetical protein
LSRFRQLALPTQGRAQYQKATSYLNNFKETIHRSHPGGIWICGWKGFARLADGDEVNIGGGASTSQADWNDCCAGFGGGAGDGGIYGDSGKS